MIFKKKKNKQSSEKGIAINLRLFSRKSSNFFKNPIGFYNFHELINDIRILSDLGFNTFFSKNRFKPKK